MREEDWPQLAFLASHHHTSEYNRAKYGSQGCPVPYVPFSIDLPQQYGDLKRRQEAYISQPSWWICDRTTTTAVAFLGPCGQSTACHVKLQEEISAAITSPLIQQKVTSPQVKTSASHPISVSTILPVELIPLISSHLVLSSHTSFPVFDVSPLFTLDRFVTAYQARRASTPQKCHPMRPSVASSNSYGPTGLPWSEPLHIQSRSGIQRALQAALSSELPIMHGRPHSLIPIPTSHLLSSQEPTPNPMVNKNTNQGVNESNGDLTLHHSNKSTLSLSLSLSLTLTPNSSSLGLGFDVCEKKEPLCHSAPPNIPEFDVETIQFAKQAAPADVYVDSVPQSCLTRQREPDIGLANTPTSPSPFLLGNLLLSSCPGKKVRLQGPVRGRSSVCRDLDLDLQRICSMGARCIICCLDDMDLEFLGAPWPSYKEAAQRAGIDILRVPMPEGLAPFSLPHLDDVLTKLVERYTMHGVNVLVHCRGGVGRAGLIACCWIVKLGLCRYIMDESTDCYSQDEKVVSESVSATSDKIQREIMQFVERVIGVVRRRRSMKAVETYEQVKFLLEYVKYLIAGRGKEVHSGSGGVQKFTDKGT